MTTERPSSRRGLGRGRERKKVRVQELVAGAPPLASRSRRLHPLARRMQCRAMLVVQLPRGSEGDFNGPGRARRARLVARHASGDQSGRVGTCGRAPPAAVRCAVLAVKAPDPPWTRAQPNSTCPVVNASSAILFRVSWSNTVVPPTTAATRQDYAGRGSRPGMIRHRIWAVCPEAAV
jgi:hypothetical protein